MSKISELSTATELTGSETLAIVQDGSTVKTTAQDIANLVEVAPSTIVQEYEPNYTTSYDINGNAWKHFMPRGIKDVKKLWSPTTGTLSNSTFISNNDTQISMLSPVDLTKKLTLIAYKALEWSGLDITVPANGLMQLLFNSSGDTSGIIVTLTDNVGGSITYNFMNGWERKGIQQTLALWNPATPANNVFPVASHCYTDSNPTFNFLKISKIKLIFNNAPSTVTFIIDGLYEWVKIKPTVLFAPDYSNDNVYNNMVRIANDFGYKLTLRAPVVGLTGDSLYRAKQLLAVAQGHDLFNGTYYRTLVNNSSDLALARKNIIPMQNYIKSRMGFDPVLLSANANSLPSDDVRRQVMSEAGLRWAKAPGGFHIVNYLGVNGVNDPTYTYVKGNRSATSVKAIIDGLMYVGGYYLEFSHECVNFYLYDAEGNITGINPIMTPAGSNNKNDYQVGDELIAVDNYSSGGSWVTEGFKNLCEYMKPFVDAGDLQVVNMSTFDKQMRGIIEF